MRVVKLEVAMDVKVRDGKLIDVLPASSEVIRVELTSVEFEEFVERKGLALDVNKRTEESPMGESGNYVVYNGLCIQTHASYL